MVITSPLLLGGNPGLKHTPPVVNAATYPEVWSEGPFGPSLFLAAAGDPELDLYVERGERFGSGL